MTSNHNNSNLHNELAFLVHCCKTDLQDVEIGFIHSYLENPHSNIQHTLALANAHGILPLVYKTLQNHHVSHFMYDDTLSAFKQHYLTIAHKNMLMSAELIKISNLLSQNSIEALAFKGPALSQMAYGDITLRQFGDLDILIKKSDISSMIDLLIAHGYTPQIELGSTMKASFIDTLTVIGFYKNTTQTLIEVHWDLLSKNYAITWDDNALWAQKKECVINHTNIPVLTPQEQILYLCVHGSKHLFERLEWICDIDRSARAYPDMDWTALLQTAEKCGIKRMFCLGLALCEQFFELTLPETIQDEIQKDKTIPKLMQKIIEINFSDSTKEGKTYGYFLLMWQMRENLSDKLRFTWYAFFAPQFDDYIFIKLPKYLGFLYPLVRPYRLLSKYFKG